MWWNYRKPRPLKPGAFHFAASTGAPVLPFFLTMQDTDVIGADGFPIQAYTVHILPAIEPDPSLTARRNAERMCEYNDAVWKQTYEDFYGIPLRYTTQPSEGE
jgi:1-acyl-sn-glycerol-3-phosphate acyltransferase